MLIPLQGKWHCLLGLVGMLRSDEGILKIGSKMTKIDRIVAVGRILL